MAPAFREAFGNERSEGAVRSGVAAGETAPEPSVVGRAAGEVRLAVVALVGEGAPPTLSLPGRVTGGRPSDPVRRSR